MLLSPKLRVLIAGDGADNIGKQSGGWSITWQGTNNSNPGGTSIYRGIAVVSVFLTGRPLWVNAELNASDAFVEAWLPGSEGGAQVLFSKLDGSVNYAMTGKLSYSWPATAQQTKVNRFDRDYTPLFPYGYGLC
ncbi:1,4-beta-D-glucan glucohydrolase D [Shewanella benthica KT99]|uniref:1,4-beta-D-glucan glucohydrolase D n=1 Tax=Shewanella benthica KT99 TaxID=314608 RepID=A9D4A3_9GAMM|nr:1,4-beta-D-glucan glucohydrolase D [Shewanella benthica KT99]